MAKRKPGTRDFDKTTRDRRCPVCDNFGHCMVKPDGTALCMKVEQGSCGTIDCKAAGVGYIHKPQAVASRKPAVRAVTAKPRPEAADPDTLDQVYNALLARLPLSAAHRENLRGRGLPDHAVAKHLYATLPGGQDFGNRGRAVEELRGRWPDEVLLTVPGIVKAQGKTARKDYLNLAGGSGILVPIRDHQGRILGCQVRLDEPAGKHRYHWFSSAGEKYNGPGPGAPPHLARVEGVGCERLRWTEGGLKAAVAAELSRVPTVGTAGLCWRDAVPVFNAVGARVAVLAVDADAARNVQVARQLRDARLGFAEAGFAVEMEAWDEADGKGIDDLLQAGKQPRVLAGPEVVAEVDRLAGCAEAEAVRPENLPARVAEVLAEGGAPALYRDGALLLAVARLKLERLALFLSLREEIKKKVGVREFDQLVGRAVGDLMRQSRPGGDGAEEPRYVEQDGCLCLVRQTEGGEVTTKLADFTARVEEEAVLDDDSGETRREMVVSGALPCGEPLPEARVPAARFEALDWVAESWGARAVIHAGRGVRDHARAAIQKLSTPACRTLYAHTGWRKLGDRWVYLHAGGAIGEEGLVAGVETQPPDTLRRFQLPAPAEGEARAEAVRASLGLLRSDVAPDEVTVPLYCATYRAALGDADFSLFVAGPSGSGKSEWASLLQQHYGAGMDARYLPANWSSTANYNEALGFAAKDALIVVDDYCPSGSAADVQRMHRDADRLFRGQGNHAGRGRLRPDSTSRPTRSPRGLVLATGEDLPPGASLLARVVVVQVDKDVINLHGLTPLQKQAADGLFATSMACFVRWLAPQLDQVRAWVARRRQELRDQCDAGPSHARTPENLVSLVLGLECFLRFARECGVIDAAREKELRDDAWRVLVYVGRQQAEHLEGEKPGPQFLSLLGAAVRSGRAHVAALPTRSGGKPVPPNAATWGWRQRPTASALGQGDWEPQGKQVGWLEPSGDAVYLDPEASFAEAKKLAAEQQASFAVTQRTLWKRLYDDGLLAETEERSGKLRLKPRKTVGGPRLEVVCVRAASLIGEGPADGIGTLECPNGTPKTVECPRLSEDSLAG